LDDPVIQCFSFEKKIIASRDRHRFPVIEVRGTCFDYCNVFRIGISRTVGIFCVSGFTFAQIHFLAFESGSRLREVGENAFASVSHLGVSFFAESISCISCTVCAVCYSIELAAFGVNHHRWISEESDYFADSFGSNESFSSFPFQLCLKLTRIEMNSFRICSSPRRICIPASVEIICSRYFYGYSSVSSLFFEHRPKLIRIEEWAFSRCLSFKSFFIQASLEMINSLAISRIGILILTVENDIRVIRYFDFDEFDGNILIRWKLCPVESG
jgi:hypothetical protein